MDNVKLLKDPKTTHEWYNAQKQLHEVNRVKHVGALAAARGVFAGASASGNRASCGSGKLTCACRAGAEIEVPPEMQRQG
jgi:hypothetical protein